MWKLPLPNSILKPCTSQLSLFLQVYRYSHVGLCARKEWSVLLLYEYTLGTVLEPLPLF